jgi:hypothetical protein
VIFSALVQTSELVTRVLETISLLRNLQLRARLVRNSMMMPLVREGYLE